MSIRWACNEVKWAWQRLYRGWDDRATWSADYYFARQISEILDAIKSDCGIPHFVFIDLGIPVDTFMRFGGGNHPFQRVEEAASLLSWYNRYIEECQKV